MNHRRLRCGQLGIEPKVGLFQWELQRRWEAGGLRQVGWGAGKHLDGEGGKKGLGQGSPQ